MFTMSPFPDQCVCGFAQNTHQDLRYPCLSVCLPEQRSSSLTRLHATQEMLSEKTTRAERSPSLVSSAESSPIRTPDGAGAPEMEAEAPAGTELRLAVSCKRLGMGRRLREGGRWKLPPAGLTPLRPAPGSNPSQAAPSLGVRRSAHSISLSLPLSAGTFSLW